MAVRTMPGPYKMGVPASLCVDPLIPHLHLDMATSYLQGPVFFFFFLTVAVTI